MSIERRIAFGAFASVISRFLAIGLNLFLVGLLFRYLGKEELGLWFLLGRSGAFLRLMDLGLMPTLTRRIAFMRGKSGSHAHQVLTPRSVQDIADLVATGLRIYKHLAVVVFILTLGMGLYFLTNIPRQDISLSTIWTAWTLLCLGHAIAVRANIWNCLLTGTGFVGWDAIINLVVNTCVLSLQIVIVLSGGGLIALALSDVSGKLTVFLYTYRFMKRREQKIFEAQGRWRPDMAREMATPAVLCWLTTLGGLLATRVDQLFIAQFRDVSEYPPYHAMYQIGSNLYLLAQAYVMASRPFISQLWQSEGRSRVQDLVELNVRLGLMIMLCGFAFLWVAGEDLIVLWLGPGTFLGHHLLLTFGVLFVFQIHSSLITSSARATENEVYAWCNMLMGALNLGLTWYLVQQLGVWGVALGTLTAQLLTGFWYNPYRGLRRLGIPIYRHLRVSVMPPLLIGCVALLMNALATRTMVMKGNPLAMIAVSGAATGVVLLAGTWWVALTADHRERVLTWVSRLRQAP